MATYFSSWTFSIPQGDVFGTLPAFLVGEPSTLIATIESSAPLFTYSRRDWLHRALSSVGIEFGGGPLMDLLLLDPASTMGDDNEEGFLVTALQPSALPIAISTVDVWLEGLAAEPERLAAQLGCNVDDLKDALAALNEDESELEDGDRPHYLSWFLRSLRRELGDAQSGLQTVVHVRYLF